MLIRYLGNLPSQDMRSLRRLYPTVQEQLRVFSEVGKHSWEHPPLFSWHGFLPECRAQPTTCKPRVQCGSVCVHVWALLPFWPSLSNTFMWTTPLVLFLRITGFRPSLLFTVPSWADSSSAHHSFPPVKVHLQSESRVPLSSSRWSWSTLSSLQHVLYIFLEVCKSGCDGNDPSETLEHNQTAPFSTGCKQWASAPSRTHRGSHSYIV